MDEDVSPLDKEHSLSVVLPGGLEKNATVHGSKPVMDLLVTLCASHHLNPSDYTVEVLSQSKNNVNFKPNSPIGLLEAEKIVLKPKAGEEKIRAPYMPEATVRLLINYNKSHKTVVRVNPRLPLKNLLPVVCDKCEFEVERTVLLRDCESKEPLDLSMTLNEHGLREVFAKNTTVKECAGHQHHTAVELKGIAPTKVSSSSSLQDLTKREKKKSENKGLFSLFRKHKKSELSHAVSAPTSPGLKSRSASISTHDVVPADLPKKRRAPQPPMGSSNSTPNNLSICHLQGSQRSGDDALRTTKRRAPPPPSITSHDQDIHVDTTEDSLKCPDELRPPEEPESANHSLPSASPSSTLPPPPPPPPAAPLQKNPDSNRPIIRGKDLSDARAALAKVLTSSLSSGMLVKRLKNSNPNPKEHNGASCGLENRIEQKSVLDTNLPTENEFEDLADRKGLTTFKVVPSRRESNAEPIQDIPAKEEVDAKHEKGRASHPRIQPITDSGRLSGPITKKHTHSLPR
ncbi:hypothetical protein WMY93_022591 [Mugilogobius chulae]|uniref:Cordon-bleu ubiquitin-like domain-containing protein n=1 Tax=Mugilogobius chulae TaxID=88201 RepID=A0AAW0ND69_9GOBI